MRPRDSLRGGDYAVSQGPPLLQGLAAARQLPEHALRAWWRALCAAQWSQASAWREAASRWRPDGPDARQFWEQDCAPAAVLRLVELLVQERCLSRAVAVVIEDALLSGVDQEGRWHGTPPA